LFEGDDIMRVNLIKKYLNNRSWRIKENANTNESFSNLQYYISSNILANDFLRSIPPRLRRAHRDALLHIHNLESGGYVPYCSGHNLKSLIAYGMKTVTINSRPAKHLTSLTDQVMNWLYMAQMEFAGAQAFNDFDTLIAPFIKKDKVGYREVKQQIQKLIFNLNYCYDEETEVLTDEGFKKFLYLSGNEKVLTLNMENNRLEWNDIENGKVYIFYYKGPMFHFKHKNLDLKVTPNHRLVIREKDQWIFKEAENLQNKQYLMPITGDWVGVNNNYIQLEKISRKKHDHNSKIFDKLPIEPYLRLLGIYLAEGNIIWRDDKGHYGLYIAQENPVKRKKIKEGLKDLPYNVQEYKNCLVIYNKQLANHFKKFGKARDKFIPKEIKDLPPKYLKILLDWMFLGDGYKDEAYFTISDKLRDDVQECIIKLGYGTNYSIANQNKVWRITKKKRRVVSVYPKKDLEIEWYEGLIFCIEVKNGNMVVRRNGKVVISGNTMRSASQTPFTNLSLNYCVPNFLRGEHAIVGGDLIDLTYDDCLEEIYLIDRAFSEIMMEKDPTGIPFTFPILTINLTSRFDWDHPVVDLMAENARSVGSYYWMNYIGSGISEDTVRSMCCRLNISLKELSGPRGLWNTGEGTGSLGVVTINFPRLGYDMKGKDEDKFFEELDRRMNMALEILLFRKQRIKKYMKRMMPFNLLNGWSMRTYYMTIGVIGLNELCLNYLGEDIVDNIDFIVKVLNFMRSWTSTKQKELKQLINIEMIPGEGSSYRLAYVDRKLHPDIKTLGTKKAPYYSALLIPPSKNLDLFDRIKLEERVLPLFTGGTIFRVFLGEKRPNREAIKDLIKKLASTKIPYFDITTTFSVCKKEGKTFNGVHYKCPDCGGRTEVFSRVVGYYRPVSRWNIGKREEFKDRRYYNL